jgi:hypothetical protein
LQSTFKFGPIGMVFQFTHISGANLRIAFDSSAQGYNSDARPDFPACGIGNQIRVTADIHNLFFSHEPGESGFTEKILLDALNKVSLQDMIQVAIQYAAHDQNEGKV